MVMLGEVMFPMCFFEATQEHCPSITTTEYVMLDGTSNHIGKQILSASMPIADGPC